MQRLFSSNDQVFFFFSSGTRSIFSSLWNIAAAGTCLDLYRLEGGYLKMSPSGFFNNWVISAH